MKKITAIVAGLMLIPFTAFGMQTISEQEMDNVTGQSGVAITVDDVVIHSSGDDEIWYQNNITGAADGEAAIGMVDAGVESMMYVNAIVGVNEDGDAFLHAGDWGHEGTYEALFGTGDYTEQQFTYDPTEDFSSNPLTVQVANVSDYDTVMEAAIGGATGESWSAFDAAGHDGTNAVIIGLPTVEIYNEGAEAMQLLISTEANPVGETRETGAASFGTLYTGGDSSMAILDGRIEIAPLEGVE